MKIEELYNQYYCNAYCSYETSILLKSLGFDDICKNVYGMGIFYHDEYIDFDEEQELIGEGKKDEIEYIPGGWIYGQMHSRNSDSLIKDNECTMPSYEQALKFLRNDYNIHVFLMMKNRCWHWCVQDLYGGNDFSVSNTGYGKYEAALDAGIAEIAKNIKEKKNENGNADK